MRLGFASVALLFAGATRLHELKLQFRLAGASSGNFGIQHRSIGMREIAPWVSKGYRNVR